MRSFLFQTIFLTLGLAAMAVSSWAQPINLFGPSLPGTWSVHLTITSGPSDVPVGYIFPAVLSFHVGGTMVATDREPGDSPTALGVWGRKRQDEYIFTFTDFESDPDSGAAIGTGKIRGRLSINAAGDSWSGHWSFEFYDLDGNPGYRIEGTMTADRLPLEEPPA